MSSGSPFDGTRANPNDTMWPVAGLDDTGQWQALLTNPLGDLITGADAWYVNPDAIRTYSIEFTRPNDVTPYAAYDWFGSSTSSYGWEIPNVTDIPGQFFRLLGGNIIRSGVNGANIQLRFMDRPLTTAQTDNAPVTITYEDQKGFIAAATGSQSRHFSAAVQNVCGQTRTTNSIWIATNTTSVFTPDANETCRIWLSWVVL